jgi:hypothetical protein
MPAIVAALALVLALPSLASPLQSDDYPLVARLSEGVSPWNMFSLTPELLASSKQAGRMAWWSGEQLSVRFVRPLAVLSHRLDYALFGPVAWSMHLVNALLYAAVVALAALAYARVLGAGTTAGVAALMFAIDDAHAGAVGWISARNTVLAGLFALAALSLHMRAGRARWLAPLCTGAALFSAEAGVAALPLLLAHALVLEDGALSRRLRGLIPHLLVAAVWASVYVALNAGVRDAGWYRDPRAAPLDLLVQGVLDVPVWLWSQLGVSIVSALTTLPVTPVRLVCAALVLPLLLALWPALRSSRPARFFALAWLLCLPTLWTTVPQDRVLLIASFGGFGLLACALRALGERASKLALGQRASKLALGQRASKLALGQRASKLARAARWVFVVPHLVLAPLMFVPTMRNLTGVDRGTLALARAATTDRDVVIVNSPLELMTLHAHHLRQAHAVGESPPSLHQLYAGASALELRRIDARSLELSAERGWGHAPIEHIFSSARHLRGLATRPVELRAFTARVIATTADGRPQRVRFTFPTQLEHARTWLSWRGKQVVPFTLPVAGQSVALAPLRLASALP